MALVSCEEWLDKCWPKCRPKQPSRTKTSCGLSATNSTRRSRPTGSTTSTGDEYHHNEICRRRCAAGRTIPRQAAAGHGPTCATSNAARIFGQLRDTDVRNRYDALARFFKVYFYFERSSGSATCRGTRNRSARPIPNSSVPRDSREVRHAAHDRGHRFRHPLPAHQNDLYRITKWTALASEIAFLPLRRHVPQIPRHRHRGERLEILPRSGGEGVRRVHHQQRLRTLHHGRHAAAYRDLFVSEDAQQLEVVLARDYTKGG